MKKALWFLSALALAGFGMVACDGDDSEPCGGCAEGTVCIDVQNAPDACMDGTQVLRLVDGGCLDADTGNWVAGQAVIAIDGYYHCSADDINYADTCTSSATCPTAKPYCDPVQHICTEEPDVPEYHFVRIDDMYDCPASGCGEDPGADIDAVALIKSDANPVYAKNAVDYKRADGVSSKSGENKYIAADPNAATGNPDSIYAYPNPDGNCKYYKDGSGNIGNKSCETNKDAEECDWDYTFVSLGGRGGYIVLEFLEKIEAGDKIDVLEISTCNLKNTMNGGVDGGGKGARAEPMQVSVAVSSGPNADWKALGTFSANANGVATFTVSGTNL